MDRHELQGIPAQVIQPPLRAVGQDADVAAQHLGALLDIAGELFFGFWRTVLVRFFLTSITH